MRRIVDQDEIPILNFLGKRERGPMFYFWLAVYYSLRDKMGSYALSKGEVPLWEE